MKLSRRELVAAGAAQEEGAAPAPHFARDHARPDVHNHRILIDLVQPGTQHFWRHPFARDLWRFIDVPAE